MTTTGRAILQQAAFDKLMVLGGKTGRGKLRRRHLPKSHCHPHEPGPDETTPAGKACVAYRVKHYDPYSEAILVDDGADLIGATLDSLFVLDGKTFAEKSRVKLAVCS